MIVYPHVYFDADETVTISKITHLAVCAALTEVGSELFECFLVLLHV